MLCQATIVGVSKYLSDFVNCVFIWLWVVALFSIIFVYSLSKVRFTLYVIICINDTIHSRFNFVSTVTCFCVNSIKFVFSCLSSYLYVLFFLLHFFFFICICDHSVYFCILHCIWSIFRLTFHGFWDKVKSTILATNILVSTVDPDISGLDFILWQFQR